jgi:hypothetical protein
VHILEIMKKMSYVFVMGWTFVVVHAPRKGYFGDIYGKIWCNLGCRALEMMDVGACSSKDDRLVRSHVPWSTKVVFHKLHHENAS